MSATPSMAVKPASAGMVGTEVTCNGSGAKVGRVIAWQPQFRTMECPDSGEQKIETPELDRWLLVVQFDSGPRGHRECHYRPSEVRRVDGEPVAPLPTPAELVAGKLRRDG